MLVKSAKMTNNFYKNKEKWGEILKAVDNSFREKSWVSPHIWLSMAGLRYTTWNKVFIELIITRYCNDINEVIFQQTGFYLGEKIKEAIYDYHLRRLFNSLRINECDVYEKVILKK